MQMIFEDELKQKLIKAEVELIILSFKISDNLGETAVKSAMGNFYNYLCSALGEDKIITSMNIEYRKFTIDLIQEIPEELLPKAMPIILGIR